MTYRCPKCHRYGMVWDARGKVLACYYDDCRHVIRGLVEPHDRHTIPTPAQIEAAIRAEEPHVPGFCEGGAAGYRES